MVVTKRAGSLESVNTLKYQRRDDQKRKHDQPGADTEYRLATPRRLARLSLIARHLHPQPRCASNVHT